MNSSASASPCPICFGTEAGKAFYARVSNHSWGNHNRCDAHGICWLCLQQYVEMKIMDDGVWNIRCPGERCSYRLLEEDVKMAVKGSTLQDQVLSRYSQLRHENCVYRLRDMIASATSDPSQNWILSSCQVCPNCYVITRREDGCNHIVCRCGCDFCFGCGAPNQIVDHLSAPRDAYACCCTDGRTSFAEWLCSLKSMPPLLEDSLLDLRISHEHHWLTHGWRNDLISLLQDIGEIEANWDEVWEYSRYGSLLPFDRSQRKMELDELRYVSRLRASRRQQHAAGKKEKKALAKDPPRGGRHKMTRIDMTSM